MVEKLLTNWLSICLYAFLKVRGARDGTVAFPSSEGCCCGLPDLCPQFPRGPRGMRGGEVKGQA